MLTVVTLPGRVTASAAAAKPMCPVSAADEQAAMVTARLCGGRVLVDADESPTTEVYALSDGSLQATSAMARQRVAQSDGSWTSVDLTMHANTDGSVAPVMSAFDVKASGTTGAGEHQLASIATGAGTVALDWTGALPAPMLAGNTATYVDVRPGVDLVVTATASGVEQNVVIKNRLGLAQVMGLSLPIVSKAAASFTADAGSVALKDSKGTVFARVPGMAMWDATIDPATGEPARHALSATVSSLAATAQHARGVNLALTPDQAWLNDAVRQFPITLDPTINPESTTFDTYVRDDLTSDRSGDTDLQVGVTSGHKARAFLSWDTTALEHATINSATVNLYNFYSQSCTQAASTQWEVWSTSSANTTPYTQWSNQPAKITQESTSQQTKGFNASCAAGWVAVDGKNFFQDAANTGKSRGYMEVVATDEGPTSIGFKQFRSRNASDPAQVPYAVVNYTSTPVVGTRSTTPSVACVTGGGRPYLSSKTPKLSAVVSQGDGATSTVNIEWWAVGGSAKIGSAAITGVVSGDTASATVPAGAFGEGSNYMWRVDAGSGTATSAWSPWCEFTTDTIAPSAAPSVSSTDYPAGVWSGSAGVAGTFTLGAAGVADVASYLYGLDANPPTTVAPASVLGGTAAVSLTPASNGPHTVYAQSLDRAGNKSPVTSYAFYVGNAAVTSPGVGSTTAGTTILQGAAPSGTTGVTFQWRRADTDTWTNIPTSDVKLTVGGGAVSWPVAASGGVYPQLNWTVKQTLANANTPAGLAGRWLLNDGTGSTAADSSGQGHPGTTSNVTWSGDRGGCAVFNGTTSQIATATSVLNTAGSFTVGAWAYLTSNTANDIIVSQNGSQQSGFDLRYNKSSNHWAFGRWNADVTNPTTFIVAGSGSATPTLNTWTHLVGTFNAANGAMSLYVNGVLTTGTGTDSTPFNTTGPLVIGHGEFNNAPTSWFNGEVADVQTYSSLLTGAQIAALYNGAAVVGSGAALAGPVQTRAVFTGGPGGTSPQVLFTFDPNLASGATSQVGPGSVNLVTGNFTVSGSDVSVASYGSDLTTARTFNTRQAGVFDGTHMFGPGWASTATVADAEAPYTGLTVVGSLVQVGLPDGSTIGFTAASTAGQFVPQVGAEDLTLTLSGSIYTLVDQDTDKVVFTPITGAPAGQYTPTAITEPGSGQTTSMTWTTATIDGVTVTRPTQLLAPAPAGVSCTTLVKGCRALQVTYASTTTATGTSQAGWGDFTGRVKKISFTAWDPATSVMKTVDVAAYEYDSNGRLTAQWDPRLDNGATHLWTTYTYNTDGALASVTDNTQPAWNLTYTTIPSDKGPGRLATASQSALTAGTATATVVYSVPISGTGAPYDMSVGQTARWDEVAAPAQAAAVFDPGQIPNGNQTTGVMPTSWTRATVTYLDANSRSVNTVTPGGNGATTWYDQFGNTVRSLTAADRTEALAASGTDTPAQEAAIADTVSTRDIYDSTGTKLLTELGPQHNVTLSSGVVVPGRDLTLNTYDVGAPVNTCPCGLVTTAVTGVRWWDSGGVQHDADTRTTTTSYDWTLRQPLVIAVDPAGLALTTTTAYDATTGLTTSVTTPAGGATTNTPATTATIYYSTAPNVTYPECGGHAEWANLACRSQPGGQAASGPELPVTVMTYDMYNQPTVIVEKTSAGTLRTTTTTHDTAGRVLTTAIVGVAGTGNPVTTQRNVYDPTTGQLTNVQSLDAGNNSTAYTTTGYDALGRIIAYTDTDGVQSTTSYDLFSRPTTVSDGMQSTTTSYDTGGENRGLATQIVDGQAGTITGSYDPDGNLTTENWPNGIVVTRTYNETGAQTGITYTKTGCGQSDCTLYTQTAAINASGDIAGLSSTLSGQNYTYDATSRLTTVNDIIGGQCTTRIYAFGTSAAGRASDRTSLTSYDPAADGTCQTTTSASSATWTYDTADRLNTPGYSYDGLGRTTTIPQVDTQVPDGGDLSVTYNVNDLVASMKQGSDTATTYSLDVDNQRVRSWSTDGGVTQLVNHYSGTSDSPSWTSDGHGSSTRVIAGLGGMAATGPAVGNIVEWQISNLHGDIIATTNTGVGFDSTSEADEYGKMRQTSQIGADRYAWLGSKQRAANNPDGIILMGVRLYNPALGRFLSTDPVTGGSCNRYDYTCQDPSSQFDLDGRCGWSKFIPVWNLTCLHWRMAFRAAAPDFRRAGGSFWRAANIFWHTDITQDCWHGAIGGLIGDGIKNGRITRVGRHRIGGAGRRLIGGANWFRWLVAGCALNIYKNQFSRRLL